MKKRAALVLLLLGCSDPSPPATASLVEPGDPSPALERSEATELDPQLAVPEAPVATVLDRRGELTLSGAIAPPPPNGDPDRVIVLGPPLAGRAVLDARYVGDHLVVLDADHVLRVLDAGAPTDGGEVILDEHVEPPLSVSGGVIAYARGDLADQEIVRAVPATLERQAIAPSLRPAWSPALSPDGRAVAFVTSASGRPVLHRSDVGPIESPRFPTAPRAPVWLEGDRLVFEDEQGIAWVDLTTGALVQAREGTHGLVGLDGALVIERDGSLEALR